MSILFLRFLAFFYVVGMGVLIILLCSKDIVEKKRKLPGLFLFPVLLFTKEGRAFLTDLIKGDSK